DWLVVQPVPVEVEQLARLVRSRVGRNAWPGEVDEHPAAPEKPDGRDWNTPLAERERCRRAGPAAQPGTDDSEIADEVAEIDHPGRRDCDDRRAGVLQHRNEREDTHGDAGADRRVPAR